MRNVRLNHLVNPLWSNKLCNSKLSLNTAVMNKAFVCRSNLCKLLTDYKFHDSKCKRSVKCFFFVVFCVFVYVCISARCRGADTVSKWVHALSTEENLCFCLCLSVSLYFFVSVFVPAPKWVHALITEERWFHPFTSTGPITTQQVALRCTTVKLLLHETNNLPMKKSTGPITARCSAV